MKNIIKITTGILLTFIMIVTSMINVNAAQNTISIGGATKINNAHINNLTFSYKVTTDGRYLYCLNRHKGTASNVQANLVSNSSLVDGGVLYILKNGYPERSITGDREKDYYITQTAVWSYLDQTHGTNNLNGIKSTPQEAAIINQVNNLVNGAKSHRNDSTTPSDVALAIDAVGGTGFDHHTGYYLSNEIKAIKASNVSSYAVLLENPPANTLIFQSGREFQYTGAFTVGVNETFRVKIPDSSATNTSFNVVATAVGPNAYGAYEYQPVNGNMQNVVLLTKEGAVAKSSVKLTLTTSPSPTPTPTPKTTTKVSINKVDATTKKAIAGAELVVKDSNGKIVSRWTSTINAHIINNLSNGFYTIEEIKAPNGYLKNEKGKTFTIDGKNNNITIAFENTPKNVVVNINKIDSATKQTLSGAVIVVKDSSNREVARFTTTENPYVLTNLDNGTYTVEEVSAPSGYIKSNERISFTVDDNHLSHQITIANTKETPVPNTASTSSLLIIVIGIIMTGFGIQYIKKNAKN